MKSGIVMMISPFVRARAEGLHLSGDVILALVNDEEGGEEAGARYLVENQNDLFQEVRYAIAEFGGFSYEVGRQRSYPIMVAEKQTCHLRVMLRGPGGHAFLPQRDGAIGRMETFLRRLEQRRPPGHVTPVMRTVVRAISEKLSWPQSVVFRQLLNQKMTDTLLKVMCEKRCPLSFCSAIGRTRRSCWMGASERGACHGLGGLGWTVAYGLRFQRPDCRSG